MKIQEYQNLAKRTSADLGSLEKNLEHMHLGVISEIGELADAYKKHKAYGKELDLVNVSEEIADVMWYVANLASFNETELVDPTVLGVFIEANTVTDLFYLTITSASLVSPQDTFNVVYELALKLGLKEEDFYKALENNINKLQIRYPEKFTTENALNRDLSKEREELEK